MKKTLKIKTKDKNYTIIIENNSIIKELSKEIKLNNKIFIIADNKISHITEKIKKNKNLHIINIQAGEMIKSFNFYEKIITKLLKLKIDRSSCIIAIGGGTIGDLSGFIASTVLRGIKFILIPTTLLSQVDSAIGGKNGINSQYGKNLIGTFNQPDKVIIDPSILKILPKREIKSGYAEIVKHALIKDRQFFKWLDKNYNHVLNLNSNYIIKAIIKSIQIKSFFIQKDEKEYLINSNSRAILNFGHTFGHALETMNNYSDSLTHGEAISIGMSLASKMSNKLGLLEDKEYRDIILHFKKTGLPINDYRIKKNKIYNLMQSDKKNLDSKINLILINKIGKAIFKRGIEKEDIKKILN